MKKNLIFILSASLILLLSLSIVSAVSITGYVTGCLDKTGDNPSCAQCTFDTSCTSSGCSWKEGKCTAAQFIDDQKEKTKTVSLGRGWKPTKAADGAVCYLPPEKNTGTRKSLSPFNSNPYVRAKQAQGNVIKGFFNS